MADNSVNHLHDLINRQIDYQEDLSDCLSKADALAKLALGNDFFECQNEIQQNFLWALNDIIDNAKVINEQTLSLLFERRTSNTEVNTH
jgi:hypothetical protein